MCSNHKQKETQGKKPQTREIEANFKTSNADFFSVISGRRYYNPEVGRWVNRDPIQEKGGLNVYGFIGNDSLGKFDLLGMMSKACCGGKPYDPVKECCCSPSIGKILSRSLIIREWVAIHSFAIAWYGTSPGWSPGNQCYEQASAFRLALAIRGPLHAWISEVIGGEKWAGALRHHVNAFTPNCDLCNDCLVHPQVVEIYRPLGSDPSRPRFMHLRDFRYKYPIITIPTTWEYHYPVSKVYFPYRPPYPGCWHKP